MIFQKSNHTLRKVDSKKKVDGWKKNNVGYVRILLSADCSAVLIAQLSLSLLNLSHSINLIIEVSFPDLNFDI